MATYHNALLRLQGYVDESDSDLTARLLRALLEHAPTDTGQEYLAKEIARCDNDEELRTLSSRYFNVLIAPMRVHGGKTPVVSDYSSRPSAGIDENNIEHLVEVSTSNQRTLKKLCLRRDNFRCVISERVDFNSVQNNLVDEPEEGHPDPTNTVAAHIIPFSIAAKSDAPANVYRSSAIYEILECWGGIKVDELNGNNINRVENLITLTDEVHFFFGPLNVWLDAVEGQRDTYRLRKAYPRSLGIPNGTIITFHRGDTGIPLPDPRYIAIHAACAQVLHASGAAKVIDRYLRGYEEMKVLAPDGSSSQLLRDALSMVSVA